MNLKTGKRRKYIWATFLIFLIQIHLVWAQNIEKEVTVVKPYQPSVIEATKINQMPVFYDTVAVAPVFIYSVTPVRTNIPFKPRQISAAKMSPEPLNNLYGNSLKLGLGTRISTLAELSLSSLRSKKYLYNIYLTHQSADGTVKLENNRKADAPYSDNKALFNGKYILKELELTGNAGFFNNKTAFYGYNPTIDTFLNKKDVTQKYNGAMFNVAFESLETDSSRLYYKINGAYDYITDKFNNDEGHIAFKGHAAKQYGDFYLGAEIAYDYFQPGGNNSLENNTVLSFSPYLSKRKGDWRFLLGFDGTNYSGKENIFYNHLRANLEFIVAPSILQAFVGYDGFLEKNNLAAIAETNPFIMPGLNVRNTDYKTIIYVGLKGSINSNAHFLIKTSYSEIRDQYLFINDTTNTLANQFLVVYDDIEKVKFAAELDIKASEKVSIMAKSNYYIYSMTRELKPWQLPVMDATISVKYNLRNKIILTAELFAMGKRFARDPVTSDAISMKPFSDFNFGIEYRYTKLLSLFMTFKNLTGEKYSWYNQYPVYRFQVLGGFTYTL